MKLQVVEINEKDYQDLCILLLGCDLGSQDSITTINMDYLTRITSQDWGWYTTCYDTLEKLILYIKENFSSIEAEASINKIKQILIQMEQSPKSLKWRMRGAVGRKIQWYELPEETRR
jgi:hypothetical protein